MFVLTALPDTFPVPLDGAGMPGVVVHVRPLDAEELAKWFDLYPPGSQQDNLAAIRLARQQLASVDGLQISRAGAAPALFDAADPVHVRELLRQKGVAGEIFTAIVNQAGLTKAQAGKSDSLSDSPAAPSGANSPAADAPPHSEINTSAGCPIPDAIPVPHG